MKQTTTDTAIQTASAQIDGMRQANWTELQRNAGNAPLTLSNGQPMNPEAQAESDRRWANSHQGRMIATRAKRGKQARREKRNKSKVDWCINPKFKS